ncbi:MAG: wax ester/triacylglycerol synthase family O-acyltransferase [Halioglobus sp.]|nr:wax ester/triacylglycerol synthase family O-acyltransferase [Halioglobus sp.]
MATKRMKPLDAVWLLMESADTPMHVGVLATFHKPRGAAAAYLSQWAADMRDRGEPVWPWNARLLHRRGAPLHPVLVCEHAVDLDYHFRHSALPRPGGERELGIFVSRLHGKALDGRRPLWEFHLIEGLAGDRFAFYIKVHHALINTINGVPLLLSTLSSSARARPTAPLWAVPVAGGAAAPDGTADADPNPNPLQWGEVGDAVSALGESAMALVRPSVARGHGAKILSPVAPRSTLNRRINAQRRFATQQFTRARIQRLADATHSTLNEILAYLCGSSLRRFFKEYNALPDASLVGVLPVSLREHSERLPGNAIAGIRVALATHIGDPLARLAAVKASMQAVRAARQALPEAAVTPRILLRAAPLFVSQLPMVGGFVPPPSNLTVSNTLGPERPLYYNGARMESVFPLAQLMQYRALSIDCVSYAGTLNIGFTGARDTLPHLQRLAVYMGNALSDLELLVKKGEGAP